jgi:hypothetical protein
MMAFGNQIVYASESLILSTALSITRKKKVRLFEQDSLTKKFLGGMSLDKKRSLGSMRCPHPFSSLRRVL